MNETGMVHNQLIINTGGRHTGIIFAPFNNATPSDYTSFSSSSGSPHRAPITPGGSGWVDKPDAGGTDVTKQEAPIGEPWVLFLCALIYLAWRHFAHRKHIALLFALLPIFAHATVTALTFSPMASDAGQRVTVTPTIPSRPEGKVYVCWSLYHDAACVHQVPDVKFHEGAPSTPNAVWFTAPEEEGTYYIKTALHTGSLCGGLLDSYWVQPYEVYPADADLVLKRTEQGPGIRMDMTDNTPKKAYGALRFSRAMLADDTRSLYERFNYFISFPFDVQVADIYGIGSVGSHWLIYYYDGKGRAEEGFFTEQRPDNWAMIDDTDSILHAGQGYLLQLNTIAMAQDATWPNGEDIATLFFPAYSPVTAITTVNETIPALSEAYRCTIDLSAEYGSAEADRRTKDSFWRCLGVPSLDSPSGVTNLPYFYTWNSGDNSLSVTSGEDYTFLPAHAYLVQNGDPIIWTDASKPNALVARQHRAADEQEWRLELRQGEEVQDRTYVRLTDDERVTEAFDFGQDLIKELNRGRANIYTLVGYERLAANSLTDRDTVIIPIGVQTAEAAEYTFALHSEDAGKTVTLIDQETGTRTNLSLADYTVFLSAGQADGRFSLQISPSTAHPTGIQQVDMNASPEDERMKGVRKVIINGVLYLLHNGRIIPLL